MTRGMTHKAELELGEKMAEALKATPTLTVPELAVMFGESEEDVARVIDAHRVEEDGSVNRAGPGRGHGWVVPE